MFLATVLIVVPAIVIIPTIIGVVLAELAARISVQVQDPDPCPDWRLR